MSSFMPAAGYRLTRLGQHVVEICLRIDSGQPAVPTRSTMWVSTSILDAASKTRVSLMARRNACPAACQGTGYRRQPTHKGSSRSGKLAWLQNL
jgi:hypothetical protein